MTRNSFFKRFLLFSLSGFLIQTQLGSASAQAHRASENETQPYFSPEIQQKLRQLQTWTVLVYEPQTQRSQGLRSKEWDLASIPASTYKIPHSLIGLSTGVLDLQTVFPWNGTPYEIESWNQAHTLATAFQASCVPCYQQLARKIGVSRMKSELEKLNYGQMVVTPETLDSFWLTGPSRISPRQQVQFLSRLALRQLPVAQQAQDAVAEIMADPQIPGLYAKTGWGRVPHQGFGDSVPQQMHYGWYVGYVKRDAQTWAFATRLVGKTPLPEGFAALRKQVTLAYLKAQKILP